MLLRGVTKTISQPGTKGNPFNAGSAEWFQMMMALEIRRAKWKG